MEKQGGVCCKELLRPSLKGLGMKGNLPPGPYIPDMSLTNYKIKVEKKLNELGHQKNQ